MNNNKIVLRLFCILLIYSMSLEETKGQRSGILIGIDVGILSDRNHFRGDNGQALSGGSLNGMQGLSIAYSINGLTWSTGFRSYGHGPRKFELDRITGDFTKQQESIGNMQSWVIPISVEKEFNLNQKWHLHTGIGLLGFIMRDYGEDDVSLSYAIIPGATNLSDLDSTYITTRTDRRFNVAIETSLRIVYRTEGRFDLFALAAFQAHLNPMYEVDFRFFPAEPVRTGNARAVNSFTLSIGARYLIKQSNRQEPKP